MALIQVTLANNNILQFQTNTPVLVQERVGFHPASELQVGQTLVAPFPYDPSLPSLITAKETK